MSSEAVAVPADAGISGTAIAAGVLHFISRKLVLVQLLRTSNAAGLSLITQELYLIVYTMRYLDLLALVVSVGGTLLGVARVLVTLAIVLLMRYSGSIAATYEADLDTTPRALLLLPPFVCALVWHKTMMIVEIFHQFSWYLEPLALIPQFVLLARRGSYPRWVLAYLALGGAEGLLESWPVLSDPQQALLVNPYGAYAAFVQCGVVVLGTALLVAVAVRSRQQAGLNESVNKPGFGEEWSAGKFAFEGEAQAPTEALPLLGASGVTRGPMTA